jgi:hypothetical protein
MSNRRHARRGAGLVVAGAVGSLVLLAACSGQPAPQPVAATPSTVAPAPPSASAAPPPPPAPVPTTSPLSGRTGGVGTPVVVVKLDNTPFAQPHRGLTAADIVYVEPVEWGMNRLAAVFSTTLPEAVGPVRSARISDIEIFAPYGDVAFVISGAQTRLLGRLDRATFTVVSEDAGDAGFFRDPARTIPYNLMVDPEEIVATAGASAVAGDMGLVFDRQRPKGGKRATQVTVRWPETSMQFRWNAEAGRYDVWSAGRPARAVEEPGVQRASSVLIQYVEEVDSGYGDRFGGRTPESVTVGSGTGVLLRDGRAYPIRWERPEASLPTAYLDQAGEPVVLDPGQVWIVLQDRTRRASFD